MQISTDEPKLLRLSKVIFGVFLLFFTFVVLYNIYVEQIFKFQQAEQESPQLEYETHTVEILKQSEVSGDENITLSMQLPTNWHLETVAVDTQQESSIKNCSQYILTNEEDIVELVLSPVCSGWTATYVPLPSSAVYVKNNVNETSPLFGSIARYSDSQTNMLRYASVDTSGDPQLLDVVLVPYNLDTQNFIPLLVETASARSHGMQPLSVVDSVVKTLRADLAQPTTDTTDGAEWVDHEVADIGLTFKVPQGMSVNSQTSVNDQTGKPYMVTMYIEKENTTVENYYQLYGILQIDTANVPENLNSFKKEMDDVSESVVSGYPAISGQIRGERNRFATYILLKQGVLKLLTSEPTVENRQLTDAIIATFDFAN